MTKTDKKVYRVFVTDGINRVTLLCSTYRLGSSSHYASNFAELVTNFNNDEIKIPKGFHTFSFKEELRLFSEASAIISENNISKEKWIELKMKEAYGENVTVSIEDLATLKD